MWKENRELKAATPINRMVLKLCYGERLEELRTMWWVGTLAGGALPGSEALEQPGRFWQLVLEITESTRVK